MTNIGARQYEGIREDLVMNLGIDFFEDGEIDQILQEIESYDPAVRHKVLALAEALSAASSSMVPGLLRHIKTASAGLGPDDLDDWLDNAFDIRDAQGIDQALLFLSKVDEQSLRAFQTGTGFPLREVSPFLETYLRALSGKELRIIPDYETHTDTVNIYLPAGIHWFQSRESNFALYKLAAAQCWAQIAIGSLTLDVDLDVITGHFPDYPGTRPDIEVFFDQFEDRRLALDLYTIIEAFRAEYFLMREVPGLMKEAAAVKHALYRERQKISSLSPMSGFVEGLWQYYLTARIKGTPAPRLTAAFGALFSIQYETGPKESIKHLFEFYDAASALGGDFAPRKPPLFIAGIRPEKVSARLQEKKAARLKRLEALINKMFRAPDIPFADPAGKKGSSDQTPVEPSKEYLLLKGKLMQVDEDLATLIERKGGMPGGILIKGSDIGGESRITLLDMTEEEESPGEEGGLRYDEWDYKRRGYRKDWCSVYEQDMRPDDDPFVETTLRRYGGYVAALRKKFEHLKRERRIERRQKDGSDIDFDAVVESFADVRAGISPSENIFSKIERQDRDIAVLFLLDMSGSTRGWVNRAEKESLVLLSEALKTLGDRYAIYGFSSMTRNRCDAYRVKGFDEAYSEIVKRRIAGIEPKDYTRMGPFIRHAARLFKKVDARTRLLLTLTDSKPEDWDGYKGEYGIEDTRKALIEASGQSIHPFCITIDREAPSYLPHLFGNGNYILINDVRKLPARITEIYRRLTT
jgi:nitric oxide reductase NorD protein